MIRRLLLAATAAAALASPAFAANVSINANPSGVPPVTCTLTAAGRCVFSGYVPGRPVNLRVTPTSATATCYIERSLDGSGTTFWPEVVGASGSTSDLDQVIMSASSRKVAVKITEEQASVPLAADCGVQDGSFGGGTIVLGWSQ